MKYFCCRLSLIVIVLGITSSAALYSQTKENTRYFDPEKRFSISLYGTYISSAELQNNPRSIDPIERNASADLNGGYGYGAELNYEPPLLDLGLIFYLSSEYLRSRTNELVMRLTNGENSAAVRINENYSVIPVEAGIKWYLPVSTDNFKIFIGGGGGVYFGDRTRTLFDLTSYNISKQAGFSLNILSGFEYYIARNLSASFELKFREASFETESAYNTNIISINGTQYGIASPFYTKFIIDGVRLSAGLKYQF
jgi:hypothetical protein